MNQNALDTLKLLPRGGRAASNLPFMEYQHAMEIVFYASHQLERPAIAYYGAGGLVLGAGDHAVALVSENSSCGAGEDYAQFARRYMLLSELLDSLAQGRFRYYAAETGDQLAVLFCLPWHMDEDEAAVQARCLEEILERLVETAQREYELQVLACLSQFSPEPKELSVLFEQVRIDMAFQRFLQKNQGVHRIALSGHPLADLSVFQKLAASTAQSVMEKIYGNSRDFSPEVERVMDTLTGFPPFDLGVLMQNYQRVVEEMYHIFIHHRILTVQELDANRLAMGYLYSTADIKTREDLARRLESFFVFVDRCYHRGGDGGKDAAERITALLSANFTRPELSIQELSEETGLKPSTLCAVYKRQTGVTVFSQLLSLRLQRAEQLMQDRSLTLREICEKSGFGSIESMYRAFRRQYGKSPGQYRMEYLHVQ